MVECNSQQFEILIKLYLNNKSKILFNFRTPTLTPLLKPYPRCLSKKKLTTPKSFIFHPQRHKTDWIFLTFHSRNWHKLPSFKISRMEWSPAEFWKNRLSLSRIYPSLSRIRNHCWITKILHATDEWHLIVFSVYQRS